MDSWITSTIWHSKYARRETIHLTVRWPELKLASLIHLRHINHLIQTNFSNYGFIFTQLYKFPGTMGVFSMGSINCSASI
jgi:hypothetical protein